jgi:hypothetical protein
VISYRKRIATRNQAAVGLKLLLVNGIVVMHIGLIHTEDERFWKVLTFHNKLVFDVLLSLLHPSSSGNLITVGFASKATPSDRVFLNDTFRMRHEHSHSLVV